MPVCFRRDVSLDFARFKCGLAAVIALLILASAGLRAAPAQQFVAVGEGGSILTSSDGLAWTARSSGTIKRLRAATSTADQFVVAGETGTILTSPDGAAWTARSSGTMQTLRGIAAGASKLVSVGGASTSLILQSADGITWAAATAPALGSLRGVVWGNGQFVAVGQAGTVLTSPDGLTWISRAAGTSERLDGVVWTGTQFVIIGQTGRVLTSTDGISWTSSFSTPPTWLEGMTWNAARYVVTGAGGRIATSPDGSFWTTVPSGTLNTIHGIAWSGVAFSPVGNPVLLLTNLQQTPEILAQPAAAFSGAGGAASFAVTASGAGALTYQWRFNGSPIANGAKYSGATSANLTIANLNASDVGNYSVVVTGSSGATISADASLVLRGQGTTGEQFVAVGEGGVILTSPNGLAWTSRISNSTKRLRAATSTASLFVVVGETGTILTSADGAAWTTRSSGTTQTLRGVVASPSNLVAVGGAATSLVLQSSDGITWTAVSAPALGTLRGVIWGNGLFVAVGQSGTILTSPDGLTWTSRAAGTSERLDGVVWTGTQFVIIGQTGRVLTSTDGISWNSSSSTPPAWLEGMTWNTARYVVVGASGRIATSPDGSFWTTVSTGTSNTIHGVTWSGAAFIPAGNPVLLLGNLQQMPDILLQPTTALAGVGGGTSFSVIASGAGNLTYQWRFNGTPLTNGAKYSGANTSILTIANLTTSDIGNYSVVITSSTGATISADASLILRGLGATGQQFVAVGENGTILSSPDGFAWTNRSVSTSRRLRAVTATPTQFITVGEAGVVYTSADGSAWTFRSSGMTETLRGVTTGLGMVVAVGGASTSQIITSYDGISWSAATVPAAGSLRGVAAGNGVYVAVGKNGTILTSTSGLSWTSRVAGTSERLDGVVWTGSLFAVISENGRVLTSSDGTSWTTVSAGTPPSWLEGVSWNQSRYVVVGASGRIATSPDGAAWTAVSSGTTATIHGVAWSGGSFQPNGNPITLLANLNGLPLITTQPASAAVSFGGTAILSVTASGSGLSYQWLKYGVPIPGATSPALVLPGVVGRDAGAYTVVVTSSSGSALSAPARLAVAPVYVYSTLAGLPGVGGNVDATGSAARFMVPQGVAIENSGSLLVADLFNSSLRRVSVPSGTVTTFVTGLTQPRSVTVSGSGNAYVLDGVGLSTRIQQVTPAGVVSLFAGGAGADPSTQFNAAFGVFATSSGTLYVADTYNHTIRFVLSGSSVATYAGTAGVSGAVDGPRASARFNQPASVARTSTGIVYVADWVNHTIRAILPNSGNVTTHAGSAGAAGSLDGAGAAARFNSPMSIALDSAEDVFVTDTANQTIRWLTAEGGVVTIGGLAGSSGTADGTGAAARFNQPNGIAVASSGELYITDSANNTIRRGVPSFTRTSITTQPVAQSVNTGDTVSFSVIAAGTGPFAYQWFARGAAIPGATNATLTITNGQPADAGGYSVVVTGEGGAVTSNAATLTVQPTLPAFTLQPANQVASVGQNVAFSATASGSPSYQWRRNGTPLAGATNPVLVLPNVSLADAGSYDVVASNLAGNVTSISATLTVNAVVPPPPPVVIPPPVFVPPPFVPPTAPANTAPQITAQPVAQIALLGANVTFSTTVTGTPTPTLQWQFNGAPLAGATGSSLVLNNVTSSQAGTYRVVATNAAGTVTSDGVPLAVVAAPTIATQPEDVVANAGETATFRVVATGLPAPTLQWRKNGTPLPAATNGSLVLANVGASDVGSYDVVATNPSGSVTSAAAALSLRNAPAIVTQPQPQIVALGGTLSLSVGATGNPPPTYQWRKNGVAIPGATSANFVVTEVTAAIAGSYDVVVTNSRGSVESALAQVSLGTGSIAPAFTLNPASGTSVVGTPLTLSAAATGLPAPTYQWRKNGVPVSGATGATLSIASAQPGDAGSYDVVATNSVGSATSNAAAINVIRRSFAGIYFGSFGSGMGTFALYIRADNTGVLLGYLAGATVPAFTLAVTVDDEGRFSVITPASASSVVHLASTTQEGVPVRAAAANDVVISGVIDASGSLTGSVSGVAGATLSGAKTPDTGMSQGAAGYYSAGAAGQSAITRSIVSANGQAFVYAQTPAGSDAGSGSVDASGQISVTTASRQNVVATVAPDTSTIVATVTSATGQQTVFSGATERIVDAQRLANLSSRTQTGTGDSVTIAGFVIKGQQSRPVLIRAVGPTLATFGVATALATPRLELYRGDRLIASNAGWATGTNAEEIEAITARVGGFPLDRRSADAVIFTMLAPGDYTAQLRSTTAASGVGLIEVYDVSALGSVERLSNLSTRAFAGSGDATLIAGVVVSGSVPKRVLIRVVGPTLAQLGLTGVLSRPRLILQKGTQVIAENAGWSSSADADAIAEAARQVGAFALPVGSQDAALLLNLEPGAYSAQGLGLGGASGIAIIEVYELP